MQVADFDKLLELSENGLAAYEAMLTMYDEVNGSTEQSQSSFPFASLVLGLQNLYDNGYFKWDNDSHTITFDPNPYGG